MYEKALGAALLLLLLASRLPLGARALRLRGSAGGAGGLLPHPDLAYPGKFHDEVEDDSFKSWDQTKGEDPAGWDPCREAQCGPHRRCVRRGRDTAACVGDVRHGAGDRHGASNRLTEEAVQGGGALGRGAPSRKQCPPCPPGPRDPVCASDGHSYSSKCKMQQQACVAGKRLSVRCPGRCPCLPPVSDSTKSGDGGEHDEVCTQEDLLDVSSRLKDWFGVLYGDGQEARGGRAAAAAAAAAVGGPGAPCAGPVGWMFERLDGNADRRLDAAELSGIYQDKYEHCIRPFLRSCGAPRGRAELHAAQWCSCYQRPKPPCLAEVERLQQEQPGQKLLVLHTPSCDEDGYFRAAQCAGAAARLCWCVDRFGQEVPGSRTHGAPDCDGDASGDWGSAGTQIWPAGGAGDDDQEDEVDEEEEEEEEREAGGARKRGDDEHGDDEDEEEEDLEAGDEGGYIW